jgi:hypothetical protein
VWRASSGRAGSSRESSGTGAASYGAAPASSRRASYGAAPANSRRASYGAGGELGEGRLRHGGDELRPGGRGPEG